MAPNHHDYARQAEEIRNRELLNTDEWTELFGQFMADVDTHVFMLADLEDPDDQYRLRRMIFISLRDYFRNTPAEKLAELKAKA